MIIDGLTQTAIQQAALRLKRGDLVVIPTETVYGLAADASQPLAVEKIFHCKKRPHSNPLIVHIADVSQLTDWAVAIPLVAYQLAERFWPGPLTLILHKAPSVSDLITAGQATVALRIPAHPVAQQVLRAFGGGLAAPSANRFTEVSPTLAAHVALDEEVLILDGGPAQVGIESTIVDCSGEHVAILRPGMLSADMISEVVGYEVFYQQALEIKRPGQHWLHYSPKAEVVLCDAETVNHMMPLADTGFIVYSVMISTDACIHLSAEPDAYAQGLYAALHTLDKRYSRIVVELPPQIATWYAVHERLRKAAGL